MSIITISRGTFSGGKLLAECLSRTLDYRCIGRDEVVRRAATGTVSEADLRAALEEPPVFPGRFNHRRYVYLALIQAALAEEVRDGRAVYHGLAGHLLLRDAPAVLRLRIIAPMELRVRMAGERLNMNRSEALSYIEAMDRDRRLWTHFLYGLDWGDPSLYDLIVNLERIDIDQACRLVVATLGEDRFAFTDQCRAAMNDLALACRVRAALALDPATLNLEVEAESHAGRITVRGDALEDDAAAIREVAARVPGVLDIAIEPSAAEKSRTSPAPA